jgi:alpha-beta hydrolase superfamily lysophospholipase
MKCQYFFIIMAIFTWSSCNKSNELYLYQTPQYAIAPIDSLINETYEVRTLKLKPDYAGEVTATLMRYDASDSTQRAVLYVHGYGDYFFHDHVRQWFNDQGYNFYALDLRKHGRSLLPHQRASYAKNLEEYFEEITQSIQLIKETDGNESLVLYGHSTGGLTTSLYTANGFARDEIDALLLNSPFLAVKASGGEKALASAFGAWSRVRPGVAVPLSFEGFYGQSLHQDYAGEWNYSLAWKPIKGYPLYGAWLRAIKKGHQQIRQGLGIPQPILVLHSDKSLVPTEMSTALQEADVVLDVDQIQQYSPSLGDQVKIVSVENGMHDILLSKKAVREVAFQEMATWLAQLPK